MCSSRVLLLLPLLLFWPTIALADLRDTIRDYQAEITALETAHDAWLDYEPARAAMEQTFAEAGIGFSMRYAEDWAYSVYFNWDTVQAFYARARDRLSDWDDAVASGRFEEDAVEGMLAAGMQALRRIDAQVDPWFRDDLKNATERAYWLDRAKDVGCCERLYYYYRDELSARAYADSISPDYRTVARIEVFPGVPDMGASIPDPRLRTYARLNAEAAAVGSRDHAAIRDVIGSAAATLDAYPSAETAAVRDLLMLLDERLRFEEAPVTELLDQAEALDNGPLRDALLRAAQDALHERLGHLAPLLAAGAADDAAAKASVVTRLLAEGQRLVMLRDDLADPISWPSGQLRAVSGFKAAAELLDVVNSGDATASAAWAVINDAGSAFKGPVSQTAPFAVPAGIVVAQLDETRAAFDHASDALTGVGDAIGGDPAGLDRALRAATRLEETLDPKNFVRKLKDGFIDGLASNLPFARTIIGWFRD